MSTLQSAVSKRVEKAIARKNLTFKEVSLNLGRNQNFIQQFIRVGKPQELNEEDRLMLAVILDMDQDMLVGPGKCRRSLHGNSPDARRFKLLAETAKTLPVYRAVKESSGAVVIAARPSSRIPRWPGFGPRAYGIVVADDTMAPEHAMGSTAIVDPDLTPKPNTTCVFRSRDGNKNVILIRRIKSMTAQKYVVRAYNGGPGITKTQTLLRSKYDAQVTCGNRFKII